MSKNERFVYPNAMLHTSRTKFPFRNTHKTSMLHGLICPIDLIEVVPGDTFELKLASLIRMSSPIAPIMDNIEMHVAAYYCPMRLLWENYEEFEGVNKTGAWYNSNNSYTRVPVTKMASASNNDTFIVMSGSIFERIGLPVGEDLVKVDDKNAGNILPFRMYYRIWNEQYRNQNVSAPIAIDYSNNNRIFVGINMTTYNNGNMGSGSALAAIGLNEDNCWMDQTDGFFDINDGGLMKAAKFPDVFTKSLPAPQKGPSIEYLPDVYAPVMTGNRHSLDNKVGLTFKKASDLSQYSGTAPLGTYSGTAGYVASGTGAASTALLAPDNLYASLGAVTATINDLRLLFQIQKYFEKDARYGTKNIAEKYLGHFGVRSPDATIQQVQYLGEANFRINVEQVVSTADATNTSTTKLGQPGGVSVTAGKCDLGTFSFTERGYIMIVAVARHDRTYANAVLPCLMHKTLFDFYDPLFANIGEMPVSQYIAGANDGQSTNIFGYQEPFYEYRFNPSRVTGELNPASLSGLDYWTLADDKHIALLNEAFIYEDRVNIARALTSGENGPDYIADFYFMHTAVRPMPLFSIPGLVDHH